MGALLLLYTSSTTNSVGEKMVKFGAASAIRGYTIIYTGRPFKSP